MSTHSPEKTVYFFSTRDHCDSCVCLWYEFAMFNEDVLEDYGLQLGRILQDRITYRLTFVSYGNFFKIFIHGSLILSGVHIFM